MTCSAIYCWVKTTTYMYFTLVHPNYSVYDMFRHLLSGNSTEKKKISFLMFSL